MRRLKDYQSAMSHGMLFHSLSHIRESKQIAGLPERQPRNWRDDVGG